MNALISSLVRKVHVPSWLQGGGVAVRMLRAAAPFLAIVLTGVLFFQQSMLESVQNSPHPQLLYIMLGVFVVATLANLWNLQRSVQDGLMAERWRDASDAQRQLLLARLPEDSLFAPVFRLLSTEGGSDQVRERMGDELFAARQRMTERATLPDFLGGAMIGLGLVGTFIGLLSVLQDLASLFSVMSGPQAATRDSASVFGEMVQKLQAPMRGMGTAFLASLYGLAGSLLLGVLTQSVKHAGHQAVAALREIARVHPHATHSDAGLPPSAHLSMAETQQWQAMFNALLQEHQAFVTSAGQAMKDLSRSLEQMPHLVQALEKRSAIDAQVQSLLGQGAHWHDAWEQVVGQLQQMGAQNAHHAKALEQALAVQAGLSQQLLQHSQEQAHAMQRQTQQAAQLNIQEAAQRDAQWQSALALQQQAFEQLSARLRSMTAALIDRAGGQH